MNLKLTGALQSLAFAMTGVIFFPQATAATDSTEIELGKASLKELSDVSQQHRDAIDRDSQLGDLKKKLILYAGQSISASALLSEDKPSSVDKKKIIHFLDLSESYFDRQVSALRKGFPRPIYQIADDSISEVKRVYIDLYKLRISYGEANERISASYKTGIQSLNTEVAKYGATLREAKRREEENKGKIDAENLQKIEQQKQQLEIAQQRQRLAEQQMKTANCQNAVSRQKITCQRRSSGGVNVTVNNGINHSDQNAGLARMFDEPTLSETMACAEAQRAATLACQ